MFRSRLNLLIAQKEHLERRKITQSDLARETGLSRTTISKWVSPDSNMPRLDANTVYVLCEYFECSLDDLVDVDSSEGAALAVA